MGQTRDISGRVVVQYLDYMVDVLRKSARNLIRHLAGMLDRLSGGRLHPNTITIIGFVMHAPIAVLIATRHNLWAAGLLVFFGLFDTLDGELARLQNSDS